MQKTAKFPAVTPHGEAGVIHLAGRAAKKPVGLHSRASDCTAAITTKDGISELA